MPTKQQAKEHAAQEQFERQRRDAVIGNSVMHTLGQPDDLHGVQVRQLWQDHYRVNVLVGVDAASTRVAHSYFLVADGDGNILASTPQLTKLYYPAAGGTATAAATVVAAGTQRGVAAPAPAA